MKKKNKPFDIFPGNLPVNDIERTLGIELDAGPVKFSVPAQMHALRKHAKDIPVIIPHLSSIIETPLYMGDDLKNPNKIEFVRRIRGAKGAALVAVSIELNLDGYYHVCSAYMVSDSEVDKKRDKRILKFVRPA